MPIKRQLEVALRQYLLKNQEHNNTLLLSGARQVGKSTLIQEVLKDFDGLLANLYESAMLSGQIDAVENFEDLERLLKRELNFTPSKGRILVIDEAQEARRLGRWIRFFKEKWRYQKVIVLGSILSNLFKDDAPYPVGRVEEIVLRPFSFKEFLLAMGREGLIELMENATFKKPLSESDHRSFVKPYLSYLKVGGMPEIAVNYRNGMEDTRASIDRFIGQYAMDVERYMGENYKTMFVSALKRIADISCHPIKMSQIISSDSPSYRKLPLLLEILEKWHLVHSVRAKTKHPESAGGIASKKFLFDMGFTNFFINHGAPVEWADRTHAGNLVFPKLQENFVCNEIVAMSEAPYTVINYYKETRNSREIDFVVPFGNGVIPIEVKSTSSISRNALMPMISFLEHAGLSTGILAYNGAMKELVIRKKEIYVMPAYMIPELPRLVKRG